MSDDSAYGVDARATCELFGDYLDGNPKRPFAVLSYAGPGDAAVDAIEKSLAAKGFGPHAKDASANAVEPTSYVTILSSKEDVSLAGQDLLLLMEALDPLGIICTDAQAKEVLETAYRMEIPDDSAIRIFGRSSAVFSDLANLISSDKGKRKVWEILKTLG